MGLSYHFTFSAPGGASAEILEKFLKSVEADARGMGFAPTLVLNAPFDTKQRRDFARRLTTGYRIEDERLKGVVFPADEQVWSFDPISGEVRLIPEYGVVLVITDEQSREIVFGFLRYPELLRDAQGKALLKTPIGNRWFFRDFVDSGDERLRRIVKRFREAGYVEAELDEFAAK